MKKILALALAAAMSLSLAACGGGNGGNNPGGSSANNPGSASQPGADVSTPTDTKSDFKVGAVYITSQNDTAGYTFQHHNGITTAMKNLGLDPADLIVVDNVPDNDDTAVAAAIDTVVNQGADIVFGISFGYINAMNDKAEQYPEVIFSHGTGYMANDTNFNNYFGRIYQARYLAGIAAGMKSAELGNNNIGYVAASPLNESIAAKDTKAVMDAVRELIISGDWDVFSGVKLTYNIGEDGSVEIVKTNAPLMDNQGNEIVPAGGPSVDDGVIKGSMNYNVAGVIEG